MNDLEKLYQVKLTQLKNGAFPSWCAFKLTKEQYKECLEIIKNKQTYNSKTLAMQKQAYLNIFELRKPFDSNEKD